MSYIANLILGPAIESLAEEIANLRQRLHDKTERLRTLQEMISPPKPQPPPQPKPQPEPLPQPPPKPTPQPTPQPPSPRALTTIREDEGCAPYEGYEDQGDQGGPIEVTHLVQGDADVFPDEAAAVSPESASTNGSAVKEKMIEGETLRVYYRNKKIATGTFHLDVTKKKGYYVLDSKSGAIYDTFSKWSLASKNLTKSDNDLVIHDNGSAVQAKRSSWKRVVDILKE
jgi:hypothetical protein